MENEYFSSINEVSKRLDVPAHTLRYWEKQFPNAIRPTTGAGGRRYYRADTVQRLIVIRELLYTRGLTIAGVKKLLRNGEFPSDMDDFSLGGVAVPTVTAPATGTNASDIKDAISLLEQARQILGA